MHPALKIFLGALMVVVGVYSSVTFWNDFLTMVKAGIGPLLVVVGAFVVWLESDEWKMQREQQEESSRGLQQQFQTDETEEETTEPEDTVSEEGHTCGQCGKTFDTERGLHIHQAQKHE